MSQFDESKVKAWTGGVPVEGEAITQIRNISMLPVLAGHIAIMPDVHLGKGATVGSVIPTKAAVIPAAVGVDIGCGMIATELDLTADQLPDTLDPLLSRIERVIPAGMGQAHGDVGRRADRWFATHTPATDLETKQVTKAMKQFG